MKILCYLLIVLFVVCFLIRYFYSSTCSSSISENKKKILLYNLQEEFIKGLKEKDPLKKTIKINYSTAYIYMLDVIDNTIVDDKLRKEVFKERNRTFDKQTRYLPLQKVLNIADS